MTEKHTRKLQYADQGDATTYEEAKKYTDDKTASTAAPPNEGARVEPPRLQMDSHDVPSVVQQRTPCLDGLGLLGGNPCGHSMVETEL